MAYRVLILGNRGMLGHMVEHVLASDARFTIRGVGRDVFDAVAFPPGVISSDEREISHRTTLEQLLARTDFVINCIGVTARHVDESDPASVARAIRVNAEFPHVLAASAAQRGVNVIHMSTDGVFCGSSFSPSPREGEREGVGIRAYTEADPPDATDTYGRTKLLGEGRAPNALNVRCSIIGPSPYKREGLWEWVAAQPEGTTIDGYTNHIWHGVTTLQFAEFCRWIIAEDRFDGLRATSHVLHFAPNVPCTKAELVTAIAEALGKRMTVRPIVHVAPIQRVLAMRSDLVTAFGTDRPIAEALRACAAATV